MANDPLRGATRTPSQALTRRASDAWETCPATTCPTIAQTVTSGEKIRRRPAR
ncbi:MAG: hypothetical protein IT204_02795 [Fimbriimonadaceae bacterium]|nr:hypothetical protein [Fimbriimonadaceae bacterium]